MSSDSEQSANELPSETRKLLKLKIERKNIKAKLTRLNKLIFSNDETISAQPLLERVKPLLDEYEAVQLKIDIINEKKGQASSENDETELEKFEEKYLKSVSKLEEILNTVNISDSPSLGESNFTPRQNQINLPPISLQKFSGAYNEWIPFRDLFITLVHNKTNLAPIEKLHYLKGSLTGAGAKAIESIALSNETYEKAWNILKERYERPRLIIESHVRSYLNLDNINRNNIRESIDNITKTIRSLEAINQNPSGGDTLLIQILLNKLDKVFREEWQEKSIKIELPTIKEFLEFLNKKSDILESLNFEGKHEKVQQNAKQIKRQTLLHSNKICEFCKNNHLIYYCKKFLNLNIQERMNTIKELNLCINCLKKGHRAGTCTFFKCKTCGKAHNILLHLDAEIKSQKKESEGNSQNENEIDKKVSLYNKCNQITLLSTAIVELKTRANTWVKAKALLDTGSQSNLISATLAQKLKLPQKELKLCLTGVDNKETAVNKAITANIKSIKNNFQENLEFLVLERITQDIPQRLINKNEIKIPNNIILADPTFHRPSKIDVLLGVDVFYNLLSVGQIRNELGYIFQKTKLGWIISGTYSDDTGKSICTLSTKNENLSKQIERFWEINGEINKNPLNIDEKRCEEIFETTYKRDKSGRFIVSLPFKNNTFILGDSKQTALRRFQLLEKRLNKDSELKENYLEFINEYINLKHMIEIKDTEDINTPNYYLPHHAVINESSQTTKLRVVFDGSSQSSNGQSLNNLLLPGPKLQDDLIDILMRFRTYKFVISGDIEKMFRQIWIDNKAKGLHRILWRNNDSEDIKTYELQTVTYGTTPASYLAIKCIQKLALLEKNNYPVGSNIVLKDFYVDDLLSGANSIEKVKEIKSQVEGLLLKGGFKLHKWASNHPELLKNKNNIKNDLLNFDNEHTQKTLGLQWDYLKDVLQFHIPEEKIEKRVTKRSILSDVCKIYDPLGFLGPIITFAKILIQKLWAQKLDWDESLPADIHTLWLEYRSNLQSLKEFKFPRCVINDHNYKLIELHGFSDASEVAYGASLYVRIINKKDEYSTSLLCSKSRVAPLKAQSVPRLELCAALLLSELMHRVINNINIKFNATYYWTDSTIVLHWIRSSSRKFKTFEANRISQIQELSDTDHWNHVESKQNPADILSRGTQPNELLNNELWYNGPHWLKKHMNDWPKREIFSSKIELPGLKIVSINVNINAEPFEIFNRYSSLKKLIRIAAYCIRFAKNSKGECIKGEIKTNEYFDALEKLIIIAQKECYAKEVFCLKQKKPIPASSSLSQLNIFIDERGIMRVGGRLKNASLSYDQKHQILLPHQHRLTKLIITNAHIELGHAGVLSTLYELRDKYWPTNAKATIKKILGGCLICAKNKAKFVNQIMGELPIDRVRQARPFHNSGIDYCGPFTIKTGTKRSKITSKAYLAVFVCFATKAIHVEIVSDLTTESFMNTLKRFIARRGHVGNLYSDNATTFVGANRELRELYEFLNSKKTANSIEKELVPKQINWHFIPARSPHFGGLWEAAVKSLKFHLKRITNQTIYTFEELYTLATRVESILNSRPLTLINDDPNDISALTPGHFLIGGPLLSIPEADLRQVPDNKLTRWKLLQKQIQHLWNRWHKTYLNQLQQRSKWKTNGKVQLKINDIVIIKDENLPIQRWPLGKIIEVHPGRDNVIRAVSLKTKGGITKRATSNVCKLPTDN